MTRAGCVPLLWCLIATGCTGGDDADDSPGQRPVDTASALITLPAVEAFAASVDIGDWNWGAPCRVPVREVVGGVSPRVERSFTIQLEPDPRSDGFVMSFDEVTEERRRLSEEFIAGELYRHLAVLPDIRLGPDGRFLEFVDLDQALADLAHGAPTTSVDIDDLVVQPGVVDAILDRTILGWFGFWLDESRLPLNPGRLVGERHRASGDVGIAPVSNEAFAAPVTRNGVWGAPSDESVWLRYTEGPGSELTGRVDVSAVVDRTNRRPSYVVVRIDPVTADDRIGFSTQDRRVVTFDWESAEGCA